MAHSGISKNGHIRMSKESQKPSAPSLNIRVISANDRLGIGLIQSLKLLVGELIANRHHIVEGWSLEFKLIARKSSFSFLWVLLNAVLPILFFGWLRSAVMDSQSRAGFAYVAIPLCQDRCRLN